MLRSENLKLLTPHLPGFSGVGFHGVDDVSLFDVVDAAEDPDEVVEVEHGGVGGEGDEDDYYD